MLSHHHGYVGSARSGNPLGILIATDQRPSMRNKGTRTSRKRDSKIGGVINAAYIPFGVRRAVKKNKVRCKR